MVTPSDFARAVRRRVLIAWTLDTMGIVLALYLAHLLVGLPESKLGVLVLLSAVIRILCASALHVYRSSWYLFSFRDAMRISMSWVIATGIVALCWGWIGGWESSLQFVQTLFVESSVSFVCAQGMRGVARSRSEFRGLSRKKIMRGPKRRTVVVGAGAAAIMVVRELSKNEEMNYEIVGLVDDDSRKWGINLEGIRVLGGVSNIERIVKICDADCLVLAIPSVGKERRAEIVEQCQDTGLPLYSVPGLGELLTGQVQVSKFRPVKVEEVLGRSITRLDSARWDEARARFSGKSILVTGAGGSIGSELCRQLARLEPSALVMVENNENNLFEIHQEIRGALSDKAHPELVDIRERARLKAVFERHQPSVVFHAAAFKHVPMMEQHPRDAIENNVKGTENVAQLAHDHGAEHYVQISTDKAVNPTNVMGATKRVAEMVVQCLAARSSTKFSCVRFGNVLGSRGSVLHTFRRQIEAGGPVTVTDPEVTRFFMTIPEAVSLVIQAGARGKGGEIFLLDMGEPVKIVDLARSMIQLSGRSEEDVPIAFVGLRPGEKLYEELLLQGEGVRPSGLDKVHLATCTPVEPVQLRELVDLLLRTAKEGNDRQIRNILVGAGIGFRPGMAAQQADRTAIASVGASSLSLGSLDTAHTEPKEPVQVPSQPPVRRVS